MQDSPHAAPESFEPVRGLVRFGDFEVDLASETLWRKGARVRIQQQPFQLLLALLESPRRIVRREELLRRLWPAAPGVDSDRSLNTALKKVRSALRDPPYRPRYIETVRGRGYRFLKAVETLERDA